MALMQCPGCKAEVDTEQDFCMECGEPIAGMKPTPRPILVPKQAPPTDPPPPVDLSNPTPRPLIVTPRPLVGPAEPPRSTTAPATPAAKRAVMIVKKRQEEPEPKRCPGCGTKTLASRCPGCGAPIRQAGDE